MKILIVEDDLDLRETIKEEFERYGATVSEAENGKSGFDFLKNNNVDFVLSDYQMPLLDGMGFLKNALNEVPNCPPIYIMSGHSSFDQNDFLAAGAQGYFEKPIPLKSLRELFKKYSKET
jgi:DNA-binding response OmpR family regulator